MTKIQNVQYFVERSVFMSAKNIVFNIRADEDTVNKFKQSSDKLKTTQGEFLKKLVEEYEINLGFKENIKFKKNIETIENIEFTLLSRDFKKLKETQVYKFTGRIIFTTAFRKPPLGLYIRNLREISKYNGILEHIDDADLYKESSHRYQENITLYKTVGNTYIVFYQRDLNEGLYGYLDYKLNTFNDKQQAIAYIAKFITTYEMNNLLVATTESKDIKIIE